MIKFHDQEFKIEKNMIVRIPVCYFLEREIFENFRRFRKVKKKEEMNTMQEK